MMAEVNVKSQEEYNSNDPIEKLFVRIEQCMDMADTGKVPFTTEQVVYNAYNLVHQTGLYNSACNEWDNLPEKDKKWDKFKDHFSEEHHQIQNAPNTSRQCGYTGNINNFPGIPENQHVEALANLVTQDDMGVQNQINLLITQMKALQESIG